mmetsp:Transcript_6033/g.23438  ORF Transcript_6033/g.23438 Transcript_6033/m.23438 type:complete len:204 (+) Transcript_6033:522-1133(+)
MRCLRWLPWKASGRPISTGTPPCWAFLFLPWTKQVSPWIVEPTRPRKASVGVLDRWTDRWEARRKVRWQPRVRRPFGNRAEEASTGNGCSCGTSTTRATFGRRSSIRRRSWRKVASRRRPAASCGNVSSPALSWERWHPCGSSVATPPTHLACSSRFRWRSLSTIGWSSPQGSIPLDGSASCRALAYTSRPRSILISTSWCSR